MASVGVGEDINGRRYCLPLSGSGTWIPVNDSYQKTGSMITFNLLIHARITTMSIEPLREEINRIDREIIRLIAKRQALAEKIVRIKNEQGLAIHDEARVQEVLKSSFNYAVEHKINPVYIRKIMEILIEMSEERQRECSGEGNLP